MDALFATSDTTYWLTFLVVFALGWIAGSIRDRQHMQRHWRMRHALESFLGGIDRGHGVERGKWIDGVIAEAREALQEDQS